MKKLMVAAFAVGLAAVTQAAQVAWCTDGTAIYGGYSEATKGDVVESGVAYLYMVGGGVTVDSIIALLSSQDFDGAKNAAINNTNVKTYDKGAFFESGEFYGKTASSLSFTEETDFFSVIFTNDGEADWAYVSNTYRVEEVAPQGSSDLLFTNENARSASNANWYTAAPEPTSGLLLLLGVAGLALKRKRA